MKINKNIVSVVLIPLIVIAIVSFAGLLNFSINAAAGAVCISIGIYIVYKYMHTDGEWLLFTGSSLFLIGLLLFL